MLKRIAQDVWAHERDIALPGGMSLPCRATLLRLADGRLLLHSPLAIDDATAREIAELGDVRVLVAPSSYHWMFLAAAKERFPKARVFAPAELAKKAKSLAFDPLPASGALEDGLRIARIEGAPAMTEHVFLHEPSQSLVVTDLLFNVHACQSFLMRLYLRLNGAWKKPAQSRLWRFLVKDRPAAARSASGVLAWDFDRVIVAHGDVLDVDPREHTRRALAWMTSGAPPMLGAGSIVA